MATEPILYDLVMHEEWQQDPVILNEEDEFFQHYQKGSLVKKLWKLTEGSLYYMLQTLKTQFRYQTSFGCPPIHLINLVNSTLQWKISLSKDGCLLAILQNQLIEIRSESDGFSTPVARCKIKVDELSKWRQLCWNDKSSLIAYSNSFGDVQVFDLTGTQRFIIPQVSSSSINVPTTLSKAASHLSFCMSDNNKWDCILFIVTYQGYLNCYYLCESSGKLEKNCCISFVKYHRYGVSAVLVDQKNKIMVTAGSAAKEPHHNLEDDCYGSQCGMQLWRFLSDAPHFAVVEGKQPKVENQKYFSSLLQFNKAKDGTSLKNGIFSMCLSSDQSNLVTLHMDGRISLWHFPSMKLCNTWHKSEQPGMSQINKPYGESNKETGIDMSTNVIDATWWSDEHLLLARADGNVIVTSKQRLENLLGDSPEQFDCWPILNKISDGHVLVLECEQLMSDIDGGALTQRSLNKKIEWDAHDDDETSTGRLKEFMKKTLFFFTEAERFQPIVNKPKVLTNVYRLLSLNSTTPEELFARKINLEHFGEALELAQRFHLNANLVHQRQWQSKPVTKITINDYLTKIDDRFWVLDECLLSVPNDFDSMEHLLKYGLIGTSWQVLHQIDDMEEGNNFILPEADDEEEQIFNSKLSPKQLHICKYRWQLLQYLDRLSTYEVMLGGSFKAREKYSAKFFKQFRSCNIVHQAVEFARDGDTYALEHLFSYYGKIMLPHWLPILSNCPETMDILDLDPLLPEIGESSDEEEILPWLEKYHREKDWVEQETILNVINESSLEDLGDFIYIEREELLIYKDLKSKEMFEDWFEWRMIEIYKQSKQLETCIQFVDNGIKRGLTKVEQYACDLDLLKILVYQINTGKTFNLQEFTEVSQASKIKLLMSKSTEKTFVQDYKTYLQPYLNKIQIKSPKKKQRLLHGFLVDISKTDLSCCLKVFERCVSGVKEPLIADVKEQISIAIDCIFACKRDDQLQLAARIMECLPSKQDGLNTKDMTVLYDQLDELEQLLISAKILEHHSYKQTISYINSAKSKEDITLDIIQFLIRGNITKSTVELNVLLDHLLLLTKNVFKCISKKELHQTYVKHLLQSERKENIFLAKDLLSTTIRNESGNSKQVKNFSSTFVLDYECSVDVVEDAAIQYFNAALSVSDKSMELAQICLSLIKDKSSTIQSELDLIEAVNLLNQFDITLIPLQIRLLPNKTDVIDMCLDNNVTNYKKIDKLLNIGKLLGIHKEAQTNMVGVIKQKCAESAYNKKDYSFCGSLCEQLVEQGYQQAWEICRWLSESDDYHDINLRYKLSSFALVYCPVIHLESILHSSTSLESQILCDNFNIRSKNGDNTESKNNKKASSMMEKTSMKTKELLSTVKDTQWLTGAMKWISQPSPGCQAEQEKEVNSMLHHTFYLSLDQLHTNSTQMINNLDSLNEDVVMRKVLLRAQKIAEGSSQGELLDDSIANILSYLSNHYYGEEHIQCLAYLITYAKDVDLIDVFVDQRKSTFFLLFIAYYYVLEYYLTSHDHNINLSNLFLAKPIDLLNYAFQAGGKVVENKAMHRLRNVFTKLVDQQQARMLVSLNNGVDVERFTMDIEYKKETILGLAMSSDHSFMAASLRLADMYNVPTWEVFLVFTEYLFIDSELKATVVRDHLNKWNVETVLKEESSDGIFERLQTRVYPFLNGKEHNKLLLFYGFTKNVTSASRILQGTLTLDSHIKLLKKIKAAAPSLNYKELVHGEKPLEAIKEVVMENNVHLLAKIACKIVRNNGSYMEAHQIFLSYLKKSFWDTGKSSDSKNIQWLHQFETSQKLLPKLSGSDLLEFSDSIIFTKRSLEELSIDIRLELLRRLIKYIKDQSNVRKASDEDTSEFTVTGDHLQQRLLHLTDLKECMLYQELLHSSKENIRLIAKNYDLTCGETEAIRDLCTQMFNHSIPVRTISTLLQLNKNSVDVSQCFRTTLKEALVEVSTLSDWTKFTLLVSGAKEHSESGDNLITLNDILDIVRPFCCDVNVNTDIKTEALYQLQSSFELSVQDVHLLQYFQSESIIKSKWSIQIVEEEIDNNEARYQLFNRLLNEACDTSQLCGLQQLLSSWPPFDANRSKLDCWMQLLFKMIELQCYSLILITLKHASESTPISANNYMLLYLKLKEEHEYMVAFKMMLSSRHPTCLQQINGDMEVLKHISYDNELLDITMATKTISVIVNTILYENFLSYIVDKKDAFIIKQVMVDLESDGFVAEAGTLIMKVLGISDSFCTVSNTLNVTRFESKHFLQMLSG